MDVGLFRKGPLCRHGGLPPQGCRCCAGQHPCRALDGPGCRTAPGSFRTGHCRS